MRIEGWELDIGGKKSVLQSMLIIEKACPGGCVEDQLRNAGENSPYPVEKIQLGGYPATKITYEDPTAPWPSRRSYTIIVQKNGQAYFVYWQDFSPTFSEIVTTLNFIE